jgi:hypothetical protein
VDSIVVPPRFNGPPGVGNGGYFAGLIARALGGGPAEVTLRAPAPLDRPLSLEDRGEGVRVRDGDTVVAEGKPTTVEVEPPPPVSVETAAAAAKHGPFVDAEKHPFPSCFVCGPMRAEGDGLRLFAGPVEGHTVFATPWTPAPSLASDDGTLADEVVWAALDCPSSAPISNDADQPDFRPIVLGRIAVRIDRPVRAAEPHVVVAWGLRIDRRRRDAAAALYTAAGALCAVSRSLWIELRRAAA